MAQPKLLKTIRPIFGYDEFGNVIRKENIDNIKGIYAIGIEDPVYHEDTVVKTKVGLGGLNDMKEGGLLPRIRSYYIAFPDGVWEYAFLILKQKRNPKDFLRKIEKEVHQELDKIKARYKTKYLTWTKNKPEWFQLSIKKLREIFVIIKNRYPKQLEVIYPSEIENP
jgi:hypothetical protein